MAKEVIIRLSDVAVFQPEDEGGKLSYKNAQQVLSGVELTVEEGEMVYLIGKVGSGKSSLMKTLYAELPLLEGDGEVVGYDLRKLRRRDIPYLRRSMGIVFQDYQLLRDRNVYENLRFVMRATGWKSEADIAARIEELLSLVGLRNKEYKMPHELSGGEQQRLVIARALVNNPKVILADEPTGNLDPKSANDIMVLFGEIVARGCSVVMATHNIQLVDKYPARTLMFRKGKVQEVDIKAALGRA
ncbi:MAG: ATP-binding cassette domain-containing protein [Tidjanibacter sp.]|nr:ATP-binding cassette domain-containing protein [Tidjanibacter sp.]